MTRRPVLLTPVIPPEKWRNSVTLSRAKDYARIWVSDTTYTLYQGHLVREGFIVPVKRLGIPVVQEAWRRAYEVDGLSYSDALIRSKRVCRRLVRLVKLRKRQSICNDCVLF